MPKVTLPIANGFYETDSPVISAQNCVNMYPVTEDAESLAQDTLRSIPGCLGVVDSLTFSSCAGAHILNDTPYFIIGSKLWRLTEAGGLVDVGDLSGSGRPTFADNGTQLMICYKGGNGYIFIESGDTLTLISDADYTTTNGAPQAVVFIDGYFVVTTDAKKFKISSLNDGLTWNALDFGTAESSPDDTVTPLVYKNQLFIAGDDTIEGFSNIGGAGFPFTRTGLFLDKGIYSPQTVVNAPNTFIFIGSGEGEIPAVWMFENNSTKKISNRGIDKFLREMTTAELDEVYSWSYGQSGNFFVGFVLATTCIVYDLTTGKWHERLSDYVPASEQYFCSAFDAYIKAIPDVYCYGIYSNNKTNGESAIYDETGQSHWQEMVTDVSASIVYDINDGAPSSCQEDILYMHVHAGVAYPRFLVPSPDVNFVKGPISAGAVLKTTALATPGATAFSVLNILKHRQSGGIEIFIDTSLNYYVSSNAVGATKYYFPLDLFFVINDWTMFHLYFNTDTGAFTARVDSVEISGIISASDSAREDWAFAADVGSARNIRYASTVLSYVVNEYESGANAYAAYLRTVKVPLTPPLVSGFTATVNSYNPAHYWKMDEASGLVIDSAGNNNLYAVGSPTYDSGDIMNESGAIDFNNDSSLAGGGGRQMASINMTMGAWLELGPVPASSEYILQSGNASNDRAWGAGINSNTQTIFIHDQAGGVFSVSGAGAYTATEGTKVFLVIRHSNNGDYKPEFFINGVSVGFGDIAISRGFPLGDANISLGAYAATSNSNRLTGAASHTFVINQLVPDDRILHMYTQGAL